MEYIVWILGILVVMFTVPVSLWLLVSVYVYIYNDMMRLYRRWKKVKEGGHCPPRVRL